MKVLVVTRDGKYVSASIETSSWVLRYLDMRDCFAYDEIHVYDVSKIGKVEELTLHGKWHDITNSLYMKVTDANGNTVFDGYGTDH